MDMNDIVAFVVSMINELFKFLGIDFELKFVEQDVV